MTGIDTVNISSIPDADLGDLDGRLLLIFRELMRQQNATAAAATLHVSQSTISHALSRLRRLHRDELFVRRPHGLAPTRHAHELAPRVEAVLAAAQQLFGEMRPFDPLSTDRTFRLAASEFATALLGGPLLKRWRTSAPRASILTQQLGVDDTIDRLKRGELDLAIGRYGARPERGLAQESLFEDEYCVVARREHPRVKGSIDLASYLREGHVLAGSPSEGSPGERVPREITVAAVVPAWLTALVMVAASDAIATCPRRLAVQQADTLALQIVDLPRRTSPIRVSLLHRADPEDAVSWLIAELRALVA